MPHRVSGAEFARLTSLYRYGVLGGARDPAIDETVRALASRLDAPVAQLVLADARQFWVVSAVGPGERTFLRDRGILDDLVTGGPAFLASLDPSEAMPPMSLSLRSFEGVRLVGADDEALGVLYVADTRARDFGPEAAEMLADAASAIRTVLDSGRRARADDATGAIRHDAFLDQAARLIEVSRIGRQWVSLVTLDLAPFCMALDAKAAGLSSLAMRHMADLGRTQVRSRDSFGRLDDMAFAILLTDTGEAGAHVLAQRLSRFLERGWTDAGLEMSGLHLGIASMKPSTTADTAEALVARSRANRAAPTVVQTATRVA